MNEDGLLLEAHHSFVFSFISMFLCYKISLHMKFDFFSSPQLVLNSNNLDMFAMLSLNKEDAKTVRLKGIYNIVVVTF